MMDLPNSWEKLLEEHWKHIKTKNVDLISQQEISSEKRTFGLIFKVPENRCKTIYSCLEKTIPKRLERRIVMQPWEGYHFTIQWSPEEHLRNKDINQIKERLQITFARLLPIKGSLLFPFFGRAGLLGIFKTETDKEFLHLRQAVNKLWKSFRLPLGVPPKYSDLAYLNLIRYKKRLTLNEKQFLKDLPVNKTPEVVFSEALLVLNDKFLTPENTEILMKLSLGKEQTHH